MFPTLFTELPMNSCLAYKTQAFKYRGPINERWRFASEKDNTANTYCCSDILLELAFDSTQCWTCWGILNFYFPGPSFVMQICSFLNKTYLFSFLGASKIIPSHSIYNVPTQFIRASLSQFNLFIRSITRRITPWNPWWSPIHPKHLNGLRPIKGSLQFAFPEYIHIRPFTWTAHNAIRIPAEPRAYATWNDKFHPQLNEVNTRGASACSEKKLSLHSDLFALGHSPIKICPPA